MGTVGLSFGSPTSGTGFDVSATVATIVANLRKVETPWSTQLADLQGQDTAISSLGTLLATLSNDLSQLTDFTGVLAQKTGSSSDTGVLELTAAASGATAGTHTVVVHNLATTSTGYLTPITNSTDTLSGSITLQVGSGTAQTVTLDSSDNTLAGLASAINSSGVGITASVLTDSAGSRLNLVSGTSGANGTITVTNNSIADTNNSNALLSYTASSVTPVDASLTVDGVDLTSASNTVSNLIPGITFQLLAPSATNSDGSPETIQVIIGNDNTGVESAVNVMVSDYNSLISAINVQEGYDSSGNAEALFGSPTLSLLQQQLLSSINAPNPNGYLDSIATNTGTTLSGTMVLTTSSGAAENVVIGAAPDTPAANTVYTGSGADANTLAGLAAAINSLNGTTELNYTGTSGSDTTYSSGSLTSVFNSGTALSGQFVIQVGNGTAETVVIGAAPSTAEANTIYTGSGVTTLSTLAQAINNANIGVTASLNTASNTLSLTSQTLGTAGNLTVTTQSTATGNEFSLQAAGLGISASVVTSGTSSNLALISQTTGSAGDFTAKSDIVATSDTMLSFAATAATSTQNSWGTLTAISNAADILSGSISIQVGSADAQTISVDSGKPTLAGLRDAINAANLGVTASITTDSDGNSTLTLTSQTAGSAGNLTVTSNLLDTTETTAATLNYSHSSDISSLMSLGVTTSSNADGTLEFDASSLDAILNSDFSGVVGFFQNVDSWGNSFASVLTNAGTGSSTGILSLAKLSNSSIESNLEADLSREESLISIQQAKLTAELNSANEVLQALPRQLDSMQMLYSAITGYSSSSSG